MQAFHIFNKPRFKTVPELTQTVTKQSMTSKSVATFLRRSSSMEQKSYWARVKHPLHYQQAQQAVLGAPGTIGFGRADHARSKPVKLAPEAAKEPKGR